jgi:periplasmic divalent cation tolerance protein
MATSSGDQSPVIVLTTLGASNDAAAFARVLVSERLAACVNVLPPMTSLYWWKGAVEEDSERQLVIKTTADRVAALQARFNELHPYEVAEFLVVRVSEGSAAYLGWLVDSLAAAAPPGRGGTERS